MFKMITMKDIAKTAGVARSTVSAVMSNSPSCYVSEAKRKLIFETADEMGYVPNYAARALRGISIKTIGIIGSIFTVDVRVNLFKTIKNLVMASGYQVLLGDSMDYEKTEKDIIMDFISRGSDGLIIMNKLPNEELQKIIKNNVPFVSLENYHTESSDLMVDLYFGGWLATKHLAEHNHSKIAFLTSSKSVQQKYDGYLDYVKENGMQYKNEMYIYDGSIFKKAYNLCAKKGVTAFVTSNDELGGQLLQFLYKKGIKCPEDVAIIGYDDAPLCNYTTPNLTTVHHPVEKLAEKSVAALMKMISNKQEDRNNIRKVKLKPELVIRESCGCKV